MAQPMPLPFFLGEFQMCEQCSAATKTYGEVLPHWWLVQATKQGNMMREGDFGLVWADDPDFCWPKDMPPRKDPSFGMTDEEFDNMTDEDGREWDEFQDYVDNLWPHFRCDPGTGHCLMEAITDAGYDRAKHGYNYLAWLVHRMAVVMERNPDADEKASEAYAIEEEKAWGYHRDQHGSIRKNGQ